MKKILLIIAHEGFQPVEYGVPKKILEEAGVKVATGSDRAGVALAAYGGEPVEAEVVLKDIKADDYDGVFFIGGPGAANFLENEAAYRVARDVSLSGKAYGAICYSTRVLAHAGVLKNKKATGWDGDNELGGILAAAGAQYARKPVMADGKLITAVGPKFADEWGRKILEIL